MKHKRIRIRILVFIVLLLVCGGIYTLLQQHPEAAIRQDDILTRGEFAAILVQSIPLDTTDPKKDTSSFSDIDGHWSEKYIEALIDAGILVPADYPDGFFRPDEPITHAEIIRMLVRVSGLDGEAKNTQGHSGYEDQDDIKDEDMGYLIVGREAGIIGDTDNNKIHPNDPVTKGDAEDMIDNITPDPAETSEATSTPSDSDEDQPSSTPENPDDGNDDEVHYYYPDAQVLFELPEIVHTDSIIQVMPVWKYTQSHAWTLTKTAVDGSEQPVALEDAISGTLGLEGGAITFKQDGKYTLTATAKNVIGKETVLSKQITVYPVIDVTFELPDTLHTDTSVPLVISLEQLFGHDIAWSATKNGAATELADIIDGELKNNGGAFTFINKGDYTLTATITDETDRVFSHTEYIKVYCVACISFDLPTAAHTDTTLEVTPVLTEADNLTVEWSLTKNGEACSFADEVEGTLINSGGSIRLKDKGVYTLSGTLTDETGRSYEATETVTIYPVGSIGFYLPEITHSDKMIQVETRFENLGGATIQWSMTRDGEDVSLSDAAQGQLTNEGGYIRIIERGEYTLKAAFTDPAGRSYSYTSPVRVYPVPGIQYILPETAHTDTIVNVTPETSEIDGLEVEWLLENGFGFQDWNTYVDGTMDNSGGAIRFKHAGTYELIARINDETGRVFLFENGGRIEVLPVLSISFELPGSTHTDRTLDLRTRGNNNILPVEWSLTKNGVAVEFFDAIEGLLNAYGGKIRFKEPGVYILTATIIDALGRAFSYSAATTVYPIPTIYMIAPQVWYAGETGTVVVTGSKLENLSADWTVTKDDGGAEPYSHYASGTLTNEGGSLTFPIKGQYELTLTMTDLAGRTFNRSRSVTVYPVPQLSIGFPALSYSGEPITITASGTELDGMDIDWLLSVDGGGPRPYIQHASGLIGTSGGTIRINAERTVPVKLIAEVTNTNGREFTFTSNTGTLKPIASFPFTMPSAVHIGSSIDVSLPATSGLEGRSIVWSLTMDGVPAIYSGTLSNSGGSIIISSAGGYILNANSTDDKGRVFGYSQSINVTNTAPNKPSGSASVTRTAMEGKLLVSLSAYATDPDGDTVSLEYSGNTADSYYTIGTHTVRVRAKDIWGLYSEWADITFTIANSAPSTPVITRTPDGNSIAPGVAITITAASTDPDGDAITYVWEGRPAQISTEYPLGKNVVRVKAVDATGAESPWAAIVFFVADPNKGGGMTLTGPESVILEQGITGSTITSYTFTVPPVEGHSGQDFGRVRGYNVLTGQWDQLDYGTTTNGITFSRSLSAGIYSQLEFYYYTNHQCMYNKSNITYSVAFYFQ